MKSIPKIVLQITLICMTTSLFTYKAVAQITADVNLNVVHSVGGVDTFERKKYMNLHSSQSENDFKDHFEMMSYVMNDLDVYLGREVGTQGLNFERSKEDPLRPGFPDIDHLITSGNSWKIDYANNTKLHQYEPKNDLNISTHDFFYPGGPKVVTQWVPNGSDAVAEWLANYIKHFYGTDGQPTPKYFSIINEPEFLNIEPFSDVADYHNVVADKVRELNPDLLIGGFTSAGPQFERKPNDNLDESASNPGFDDWDKRWKTFIDIAGANMDYFDVHWYDSPFEPFATNQFLREGANLEASFDMLEQYSMLALNEVKPFLISEYGSFIETYSDQDYSKKRDWTNIKAFSSMLMNYLDRPNQILKSVPFMIIKAEWGRNSETGYPYPYRLIRKDDTGTWVFTEFIKFFELWSGVKGTRVDSKSSDLDIQMETYVDGKKAYVILNNLDFKTQTVDLNLNDDTNNPVQNVKIKHLYLNGDAPALDVTTLASMTSVDVAAEATMVLEYTFANDILTNHSSNETKYYATSYLKPIVANQAQSFDIKGVTANSTFGEAVLRVSFGRDHGTSLKPIVTFNNIELTVPDDYRGYNMKPRFRWFGALEIPVPYNLLQANNKATVQFSDAGGHVSSVTLQVFDFSKKIARNNDATGVAVYPEILAVGINQSRQLLATVSPATATFQNVTWSSSDDGIVTVDQNGLITGKALGIANITATTIDSQFTATGMVTVQADPVVITVDSIAITPEDATVPLDGTKQLSVSFLPVDPNNTGVTWVSSNTAVATVDTNGLVSAVSLGTADITVTSNDGGKTATSAITVAVAVPASIVFDDREKYINTSYDNSGSLDVIGIYHAGTGNTVTSGADFEGVEFLLREITEGFASVVKDVKVSYVNAVGTESGTVTVSIPLAGVKPSVALDPGNFYFLWMRFVTSDGQSIEVPGISPITITGTLGINDYDALPKISVYPNPAKNLLNLVGAADYDSINIYNLLGSKVWSQSIENATADVSSLNNGMYILELVGGNKAKRTKKIIVEEY